MSADLKIIESALLNYLAFEMNNKMIDLLPW